MVDERESSEARSDRILEAVQGDRDPDLVLLPELWLHGGFNYAAWAEGIELDDPVVARFAKLAAEKRCYLHMGSVALASPHGRPTNTALVFGPDGSLASRYDKIHLYGFDKGEAVEFEPGTRTVAVAMPEATLGLAICFDLRFPELFRRLSDQHVDVIAIPSAWPNARTAHWRQLLRARAIESQSYVCAAATAGTHSGLTMSGYSAIISPDGEVTAEAPADGDAILFEDIDLDALHRLRRRFPVLNARRLI